VNDIDPHLQLDQLRGEVLRTTIAWRRIVQLPGAALGELNKFLHRPYRKRGVHNQT
jgi:hypothetical protein